MEIVEIVVTAAIVIAVTVAKTTENVFVIICCVDVFEKILQ